MRKITFRKLRKSKRQVPLLHLQRRARVAELWTNWQSNSGTFTHVHWQVVCRNKMSPRRTDQSMTEAAKCMFHKLLGEVRDDLNRVTSQSQGGPYAEIQQNKQQCSRTAILEENPCPPSEQQNRKSVHQTSTETPLPQSSAGRPEQVIEDDPRKQLELSVPWYDPGEWKYEFKMSTFTTTILNLLFKEAEQKGKIRNFRMHIGPGSDGSSADKLSLDLKFNP